MNAAQTRWSHRYQLAMRQHLKQSPRASLQLALRLGRQAVTLGVETLDVALIHEQALKALVSPGGSLRSRQKIVEQAERFFAEATVPIEKTHHAALKTDIRINQLTQTLRRRTAESAASTRHLKRGIVRRQSAEAALKVSKEHHSKLLQESRRLQKLLRDQTRTMLSAQEAGRQKSSHQLHDEIAQTLLAINVRLLTLKKAANGNTESLKKEIANTQRLVKDSANTIQRLAHEFGVQYEA